MGSRTVLSRVLAVAGCVLFLVGGLLLYARAEIFDPDHFADHASESLEDDRVRNALAGPIVDGIIDEASPDLINARPLLAGAVAEMLETAPFRRVFREASRRVARTVFRRERDELILNLADAEKIVKGAVQAISPKIADKIPQGAEPDIVALTETPTAVKILRLAEEVRFLGLVLPVLALLCWAGALITAPDRRFVLTLIAAGAAIAGGLTLVGLAVGEALFLARFENEDVHDAVAAVLDSFLGGLENWALAVGIGGVLVAAASSAALRPADVLTPARAAARRLTETPERPVMRVLRALGLAALALFVVLHPSLAVDVLAVVVGLLGLFFAASEVAAVVAPAPAKRDRRRKPPPARDRLRAAAKPAVIVALAVLLVAAAAAFAVSRVLDDDAGERPAGPVSACNGYPQLCGKRINQVVFPGAHNAMSSADGGYLLANHRKAIPAQLDAGIRALLIDAHFGAPGPRGVVVTDLKREGGKTREELVNSAGEETVEAAESIQGRLVFEKKQQGSRPYFCHVFCELGSTELTSRLTDIRKFLDTHPDEFLVIFIEDYVPPKLIAEGFEKSGLLRYTYTHERDQPFPTLRELIENDTRVLAMAEKTPGGGDYPWYADGFQLTQETPYTFNSAEKLAFRKSCRPNRGTPNSPLFQLNHWVEKVPRSPVTANKVNDFQFLIRRARECQRQRGLLPNIIGVDFWDEGDVLEVAKELNGIPPDEKPAYRETG